MCCGPCQGVWVDYFRRNRDDPHIKRMVVAVDELLRGLETPEEECYKDSGEKAQELSSEAETLITLKRGRF